MEKGSTPTKKERVPVSAHQPELNQVRTENLRRPVALEGIVSEALPNALSAKKESIPPLKELLVAPLHLLVAQGRTPRHPAAPLLIRSAKLAPLVRPLPAAEAAAIHAAERESTQTK
jgi:hypothetical protein